MRRDDAHRSTHLVGCIEGGVDIKGHNGDGGV